MSPTIFTYVFLLIAFGFPALMTCFYFASHPKQHNDLIELRLLKLKLILAQAEAIHDDWMIKEYVTLNTDDIKLLYKNIGVALSFGLSHEEADHLLKWSDSPIKTLEATVERCLSLPDQILAHNTLRPTIAQQRQILENLHNATLEAHKWLVTRIYDKPGKVVQ